MAVILKESVLSNTEPKSTNVVWFHAKDGKITIKVYNNGWKEVTGFTQLPSGNVSVDGTTLIIDGTIADNILSISNGTVTNGILTF